MIVGVLARERRLRGLPFRRNDPVAQARGRFLDVLRVTRRFPAVQTRLLDEDFAVFLAGRGDFIVDRPARLDCQGQLAPRRLAKPGLLHASIFAAYIRLGIERESYELCRSLRQQRKLRVACEVG